MDCFKCVEDTPCFLEIGEGETQDGGQIQNNTYYPKQYYFNIYNDSVYTLTGDWINNCSGFCPDTFVDEDGETRCIKVEGRITPFAEIVAPSSINVVIHEAFTLSFQIKDPDQQTSLGRVVIEDMKGGTTISSKYEMRGPIEDVARIMSNLSAIAHAPSTLSIRVYRPELVGEATVVVTAFASKQTNTIVVLVSIVAILLLVCAGFIILTKLKGSRSKTHTKASVAVTPVTTAFTTRTL